MYLINQAHNSYLEWVFDGGVFAVLLIRVMLFIYVARWPRLWAAGDWGEFRYVQVGCGLGLGLMLLHELVDYNLFVPANMVYFAFFAAVFLDDYREPPVQLRQRDADGARSGRHLPPLQPPVATQTTNPFMDSTTRRPMPMRFTPNPCSGLLALALCASPACAPAPSQNVSASLPATPAAPVGQTGQAGQSLQPLTGTPFAQPPEWARTDAAMPEGAAVGSTAIILSNDDYRIGPSDELDVSVFQVKELSGLRRVNSRGQIRMPLIGAVSVAGKSAQEVEDLLVERYGKDFLQDPQISVEVKLHASQQVTVFGAVQKPGVYPLTGRTTLLQALSIAGGASRVANQEEVVVLPYREVG